MRWLPSSLLTTDAANDTSHGVTRRCDKVSSCCCVKVLHVTPHERQSNSEPVGHPTRSFTHLLSEMTALAQTETKCHPTTTTNNRGSRAPNTGSGHTLTRTACCVVDGTPKISILAVNGTIACSNSETVVHRPQQGASYTERPLDWMFPLPPPASRRLGT